MFDESTEVVVVGGGQAGIAMSEHLTNAGISHIVCEKDRIAERWRTGRWDSLVANGPAWHDRFPSLEFSNVDQDGFAGKDQVAQYMEDYAALINAPIRCGVEVRAVTPLVSEDGFRVDTSNGTIHAGSIVVATGPFQTPVIPPVVPESPRIFQMHSSSYRNPEELPPGNILVVGAGSSGVQIASEIQESGRRTYLAVGPHERPPRSYRGRDFVWWLGVLKKWEQNTPPTGAEHVTIAVSGADGGKTIDFRNLASSGITLLGRAGGYGDGILRFDDDLEQNIRNGDANYLALLREADDYVLRTGIDLPTESEAHQLGPLPDSVTSPIRELNLDKENITTIIWATGFGVDYSWLKVDGFDSGKHPVHQRGVSSVPGVYFIGLPWQTRRGSSFIWGVWHDAKYITDQIAIQRNYLQYRPSTSVDHISL
ncbi:flavin-containing monooxygenase [Corynebacterium pacaense]|uniref:flavin-containing monooxygenase n=1 Tax=Corynebacterium pacaense TaxID=1816684 RepID=UPI0009BBD9C8|nr:NAD(P)/FAD-dependent oxidoreductase [Corynebacterium pacaense]